MTAGAAQPICPGPIRLGVVLPTYNERGNLRSMIERLDAALQGIAWEVVVVDDNSPDGTSDEARAIAREDRRVRVLERIGRRGLSSAAIEGMCATSAPVVAVMDADHQHDPALLPGMLAAIESGEHDLSYASRFAEGASTDAWGRPDRVKASGLANRLARKVTGVTLSDPMSGYFMLRTETLRKDAHRLSGVGFKILLDILATIDAPLRIKEFPMNFAARAEGESKLDQTVVFEFLVGLYDKWLGRIIPDPLCPVRYGRCAGRCGPAWRAVGSAAPRVRRTLRLRPLVERHHVQRGQYPGRGNRDELQLRAQQ